MLKNNGRMIEYGKDADINDTPMPAYDLIPMHKYRTPFKGGKFCIILTSRGCPFNCIYCSHSRNVRFRAAENIVEEIRFLHDKYDVKWIHFWDDIFTVNKKHTIEICKTLLKEKIDVTFQCQTRVETLDEELLTIMHKAGCRVMGLGIESAHQKTRKFIGKGIISWNIIEKNIKLTKKIGIEPMVNMMIGLPGETAKDINNSINKLASLEPGFLFPHITVAYPNTILFDMGLKKGIFHSDVWYDFVDGNTPLPHYVEPPMTMGKLKRFQSIALRRFFLRPNYILRKTSKIRSFQDVMSNLMGAFNLPFRQK